MIQMTHPKGLACALALGTLLAACGRQPAIVVGSKNSTEQAILGEIVAQLVEHRLARKVTRRPNVGNTLIAYQALQNGEISLYPEYTGAIVTEILREQPSQDSALMFERARGEMRRLAQSELLDPLGIDNNFAGVILTKDPRAEAVQNMSDAAQAKQPWKIAVSYDFQERADGISALTQYHLPMAAPVRAADANALHRLIEEGQVSMIISGATDGRLVSPEWKSLTDDQKRFTPQQACLLVKQSVLQTEPRLRGILAELSGKLSNERMRVLNAELDLKQRDVTTIASEFLSAVGLK